VHGFIPSLSCCQLNDNLREFTSTTFLKTIRYPDRGNDAVQENELGIFPVSWNISTLGDVLETIIDHRGQTPTKLGGAWSDGGIMALSAKSVKNHELVKLDLANWVDEELFERWMPEKLQAQDILMTSEAPLGEFFYLADFSHYCLSQRLFALRADKSIIEPTVLYFQLSDTIGLNQIDIRKTGTTVVGIRQSELVKVPVVIPPHAVQADFARICDPLLLQIEKNAMEMRSLENLANILMAKLAM
jgi:type I restriction enzyme S subunit